MCRGHFSVEEGVSKRTGYPADTFLDMSGWGKGLVWVNGFNLGWYWPLLGPQMTMYVPGPLLRVSENEVVLLEFAQEASDLSGEAVLGCVMTVDASSDLTVETICRAERGTSNGGPKLFDAATTVLCQSMRILSAASESCDVRHLSVSAAHLRESPDFSGPRPSTGQNASA